MQKEGSGVAVNADVLPEGAAVAVVEIPPTQAPEPEPAPPTRPQEEAPKPARRVEELFLYRRSVMISEPTDRALKTGPGVIRRLVVGRQSVGGVNVLLRDGGQGGGGRVLVEIDPVSFPQGAFELDIPFEKGLNVQTAAGFDGRYTVVWE